jgi:hypothetical protein
MTIIEGEKRRAGRRGGHVECRRGLALVLRGERLTAEESAHLEDCVRCNEWLTTFTGLARKAGFPISFRIPPSPIQALRRDRPSYFPLHSSHSESTT